MGTHFGHPHKKFDPPMSLPVKKEHHMQILVRISPTVWPATPLQTDRERDRETDIRLYIYRYTDPTVCILKTVQNVSPRGVVPGLVLEVDGVEPLEEGVVESEADVRVAGAERPTQL